MARPLRIDIPGGIYHVTSRGLDRQDIVRDDADRGKWLSLLGRVAAQRNWRVFAWALLGNHYHLFLRVPHADLSAGMHDLNAGYASVFNRRHGRYGPLFQGRFKGILVQEEYHYWELSRYVHLNPVRAGLVADPERYVWSSCRLYFRSRLAPDWLAWEEVLGEHGPTVRAARQAYRGFLQDGVAAPARSPLLHATASTLLGSSGFVERMRAWLQDRLPDREVPAARELRVELQTGVVVDVVSRAFGVSKESVERRGRRGNQARAVAVYFCRSLTRRPVCELGRHFGGISGQAVSNTVAKIEAERKRDKRLNSQLFAIERVLSEKCRMTT